MKFRLSSASGLARAGLLLVALVGLSGSICQAAEVVTNESLRLRVLGLVFPNARISAHSGRTDREPLPVKDPLGRVIGFVKNALATGREYDVAGPVTKEEENAASDLLDPERRSDNRLVRLRLYRWKSAKDPDSYLVGILEYSFPAANPPWCCRSLGKVMLLSSNADRVLDTLGSKINGFTMFTTIQWVVDGSGVDKLMVAADFSGPGTLGLESVVLDVTRLNLTPLISVATLLLDGSDPDTVDIFSLTLDQRRTVLAKGKQFVFVKKTYAEKATVLTKPITTEVSYPVGTGLPLDWQ